MCFSIAHSTASNFEHNLFSRRARGLRSATALWIFEMPATQEMFMVEPSFTV
jgi:hypothetical protein